MPTTSCVAKGENTSKGGRRPTIRSITIRRGPSSPMIDGRAGRDSSTRRAMRSISDR